jgi:hypothetical protein
MSEVASLFALPLPPSEMVALVFAASYLLVGIPLHFLSGAEARDIWGTWAGLFAGLIYIVLTVAFYPDPHDVSARQSTVAQQVRKR